MIVVALSIAFGAALGLWLRNAILALIVAVVAASLILFGMSSLVPVIASQPGAAGLAANIQSWSGSDVWAVGAAGLAALICGLAMSISATLARTRASGLASLGDVAGYDRRRKIRYGQAIEERPEHIKAESRIDRLMKL